LIGIIDSEGCFCIESNSCASNKWTLSFSISQSSYNISLLYYIKKMLGVGTIHKSSDRSYQYRIRDKNQLKETIIPLLGQTYSFLLTSKYYKY